MPKLNTITFTWVDMVKIVSGVILFASGYNGMTTRFDKIEADIAVNNATMQGINDSQNDRINAVKIEINEVKKLAEYIDPKCLKPKYDNR